jgi:hypothetical protein
MAGTNTNGVEVDIDADIGTIVDADTNNEEEITSADRCG